MKRETLDFLGGKFGDQRFTVAEYIGPRVPRPWETKDVAEEFQRAVAEGLLELAPGPRGGKGFRLTPHQFTLYQRRAAGMERRAEIERQTREAKRRRQLAIEIESAAGLLKAHGYKVVAPVSESTIEHRKRATMKSIEVAPLMGGVGKTALQMHMKAVVDPAVNLWRNEQVMNIMRDAMGRLEAMGMVCALVPGEIRQRDDNALPVTLFVAPNEDALLDQRAADSMATDMVMTEKGVAIFEASRNYLRNEDAIAAGGYEA